MMSTLDEIKTKWGTAKLDKDGYYVITTRKESRCKQGFLWQYTYYEDSKQKKIARTDLRKLEDEVKSKGLKWVEL